MLAKISSVWARFHEEAKNLLAGLIVAIDERPAVVFAGFAVLHFAVWTALPIAIYPNLLLDVIEALTYGREWPLGTDKLPPLPWWLVEVVYQVFGRDQFYYALSQVTVLAAFAAVWALARPLVGPRGALVSLLLIDGLNYFHFTAVKFNHDVMQLPFWALAGYAYWSALRHGRMIHWVVLGLATGLALWTKYFAIVLALPLGLFILLDRNARNRLATPGPYVAVAVALLLTLPHLNWLVQNNFSPFAYAQLKSAPPRGAIDHILNPARFMIEQIWYLLPAFLIALPLVFKRGEKTVRTATDFDRRIVTLLAFGPAATEAAISLVTGRGTQSMWGYPLWLFLGLWFVLVSGVELDRGRLTRLLTTWAIVFAGFAVAFAVNYTVLPGYSGRYSQAFFPGSTLGAEISKRYRLVTGRPLVYVISSMWIGGNVAHYAPERPRVLIDGARNRAPWIDLVDLRLKGAVVVWTSGERGDSAPSDPRVLPPLLRAVAEDAEVQEPFSLPYWRGPNVVNIGWAVLQPRRAR